MEVTANVITESMYVQCDVNGNEYLLLDVLLDYCKDDKAITLTDQQTSIQGREVTCKTTANWQICCQWKDSTTSWEKMFNLKESHLMHTAEFAVTHKMITSLLLTGGLSMCSRRKTELLPALENAPCR